MGYASKPVELAENFTKLGANLITEGGGGGGGGSFVMWCGNVQFLDSVCKVCLTDGDALVRVLLKGNANVLKGGAARATKLENLAKGVDNRGQKIGVATKQDVIHMADEDATELVLLEPEYRP